MTYVIYHLKYRKQKSYRSSLSNDTNKLKDIALIAANTFSSIEKFDPFELLATLIQYGDAGSNNESGFGCWNEFYYKDIHITQTIHADEKFLTEEVEIKDAISLYEKYGQHIAYLLKEKALNSTQWYVLKLCEYSLMNGRVGRGAINYKSLEKFINSDFRLGSANNKKKKFIEDYNEFDC